MFRGDTVELDQRKFDSLCDRTTGLRDVPNGRQTKQCNMYENTDSKSDLSSLYKTEPLNDEQTPLPVNKNSRKRDKVPTTKKPPSIDTPNEMNGSDKQLPTKATGMSSPIGTNVAHIIYQLYTESSLLSLLNFQLRRVLEWDSHAMTCPVMDSEIIIHRPRIEKNNSTSTETVIDSDSEIKPVLIFLFILLQIFKTYTKFVFIYFFYYNLFLSQMNKRTNLMKIQNPNMKTYFV